MRKHLYTYLRYRIQSDSESVTHMHRAHTRVHCERARTGSEFMCVYGALCTPPSSDLAPCGCARVHMGATAAEGVILAGRRVLLTLLAFGQ